MGCGCMKKIPIKRNYNFLCLDCGKKFTINTSGALAKIGNKWLIRGVNNTTIKHCSTNVKRI